MRISDWSSDVCSSDLPPRPMRNMEDQLLRLVARLGEGERDEAEEQGAADPRGAAPDVHHLAARPALRAQLPQAHPERQLRSEASRVGKECDSACRYRLSPDHSIKKTIKTHNNI